MARFDKRYSEKIYNSRFKENHRDNLHAFINNLARDRGGKFYEWELKKSLKDKQIIELIMGAVRECMMFCNRDRINIPISFVHLIPENSKYEYESIFGGIVVERVADDTVFAIKLFQKLFVRMSWSAIKVCEDRRLIVFQNGADINEGAASFLSRTFFKKYIKKNDLFASNETTDESCFDLEAENLFNKALEDFWERGRKEIPKERLFYVVTGAIVNGSFR